jgi:DNA invertase Pin-like site-specific DNA recombinase
MKIGYVRVSSKDQNESRQIDAMAEYKVDQVYTDKASGKDFNREQYKAMLKALRAGDTLVIKSLDRFGRDYKEIRAEFKRIADMGVYINVIDSPMLNTDQIIAGNLTTQFIADLVLSVLGYVAEQERTNIKQRQAEGIRSAKARAVKFGRPAKDQRVKDVKALLDAWAKAGTKGTIGKACSIIGITRPTYYKGLKKGITD